MDLAGYCRRIGYDGAMQPSRAVLDAVVLHHVRSIPFENLDAFVGRAVSLDPVAVERKLVHGGRGGWCFEQNLLLGNALRAMGFTVIDLGARVVWGQAEDAVVPRTHRVLRVPLAGRDWIVDAGFGGQTPTSALDLHGSGEQRTAHEPFRLRRLNEDYLLESLLPSGWQPMFRFDLVPHQSVDFEAPNFQLVHDPASHFTQGLRLSRVTDAGRHALRGLELVFHPRAGGTRTEMLREAGQVEAAIRDVFGIALDDLPAVRQRIAALFA
jgi:N-hydroxyarylamine O-acetyltransferase